MSDALLDPTGTGGTYKLVGGRACLDFLNTVSWPGREREHDWMDSAENWIRWNRLVEMVDTRTARRLRKEFSGSEREHALIETIRATRAKIAAVIQPLVRGDRPEAANTEVLSGMAERAAELRFIEPRSLRWVWKSPVRMEELIWRVVFDAADLVTSDTVQHQRIGSCPSCSWIFYDTSKSGRRRWCDMADCGSRSKAKAYYQRTQGKSPA